MKDMRILMEGFKKSLNETEYKLDKELINRLDEPITVTWQQIGQDLIKFTDTNEHAIEGVIDANRLDSNGGDKEADEIVHSLVKKYGVDKVIKFLAKHIKLI